MKKRDPRKFVPWLEALEDRRLLTVTFTTIPATQTDFDGADISSVKAVATDSLSHPLTYSATGLPSGLSINSSTGVISGLIADNADAAIPYVVHLTATDSVTHGTGTASFNWSVNAEPIAFTQTTAQTNDHGATINLAVSATDSQSGPLTYTESGLPAGLTINSGTGAITGTIAAAAAATNTVKVTATDATANASNSETFAWSVTASPVSITTPAAQTNGDGDTASLQVAATDSLPNTLTYSASNLPSALTIDPATGQITGTIGSTADTGSPYTVTVTATDATANASASATFKWTVAKVTLTSPGNQTSTGLAVIKLQLSATDSAAGDKLTYTATNLPTGLTIGKTTGLISGTIADSANGASPYAVTVTATDTAAASTTQTQSFTWTVNPGPINGVVFLDSNGNGKLDATDPRLGGVHVNLTGTTSQGTTVNVTAVTDAQGRFSFINPPKGTYTLKVDPVAALIGGKPSIGAVVVPSGVTIANTATLVSKASTGGLAPSAISMAEFLTSTKLLGQPFGPVGTGVAVVHQAPTVSKPLAAVALSATSATSAIDLAGHFTAADLADSSVTLNITNGTTPEKLNLTLFDAAAPQTVANFFDYIKSGEYNNAIFSRLVQGFVLQGGGATINTAGTAITSIPIGPTVPNEFKTPNTEGTIAMAQSGSDINSATDQFFINLVNNSSTGTGTNLDTSKFTVFGQLTDSASQTALTALAATTTLDASGSAAAAGLPTVGLTNLPLTGYTTGTATTTSAAFPADATASNFMTINSVTINSQPDFLTYAVTSSNPSIVAASLDTVHNEQLTLTRGTATGTATVTVTATDRFGLSVTSTITVTVS